MAARVTRERRPAVWPWLVMPLIVLLVFYALMRVHERSLANGATPPAASHASGVAQP